MEGSEEEDFHSRHCLTCFNLKKCKSNPSNIVQCELIKCQLKCGAVFHACKEQEHKQLCLNEKVPCYNKEAGCPCFMQRGQLAKHLSKCPASVIHCTMEWNRWQINEVSEKQLQHCKRVEQHTEQPQLDVALALRDQRLLRQWYTSSKTAQTALQNHFKKQPRNMLVAKQTDQQNIESCGEPSAGHADFQDAEIPRLPRKVYNQLYQAYGRYLENFDLSFIDTELNKFCTNGHHMEENKENVMNNAKNCADHRSEGSAGIFDALTKDHDLDLIDMSQNKESSSRINIEKVLRIKEDSDTLYFDENLVNAIIPHPTRYLGLNPNVEIVGQSLMKEMYTFLCCQEFRRDEYSWHFKNVHCEIHGGLNGWLQERCPLAQYGCTFSRQRLNPKPEGSKIVYNEILESFGVMPPSPECLNQPISHADENADSLYPDRVKVTTITQLPYELLRYIAGFLDSFSLSNLSLTCSLLREVCQSLLTEKGIVTLHWERKKKGDSYKWEVSKKRWCFSSHFSPVHDWCFDDSNNMSNHLKNCAYFHRNIYLEPFNHIKGYISPDESLYQKLSRSSENVITKL